MAAGKAAPRKREGQPSPENHTLGPDTPPAPDGPSYVGHLPDKTPDEDYTLAGAVRNLKT